MERLCLLLLLLLSSGCASIVNGTTQNVAVTSTPDGAKVTAAGGDKSIECISPCTMTLKRKYNYSVMVSKDGFKQQTIQLQSVVSGAVAGNIIAGGLIGWGIDAASGGDSRLVPEAINVTLDEEKKTPEPSPEPTPTPAVIRTSELDEELARITKMKDDEKISAKEEQSLRKKAMDRY